MSKENLQQTVSLLFQIPSVFFNLLSQKPQKKTDGPKTYEEALEVIKQNGLLIKLIKNEEFLEQNNFELIRAAVAENLNAIKLIPKKYLENDEVMTAISETVMKLMGKPILTDETCPEKSDSHPLKNKHSF